MQSFSSAYPLAGDLSAAFKATFGTEPHLFHAPGRVNLIGEHTDYNDGLVMPGAIDRGITFAIAFNGSDQLRLRAHDLDETYTGPLQGLVPVEQGWANYLLGVVAQLQQAGHEVPGFDCICSGNIPQGAGLSSSAAMECGLISALNHLLDLDLDLMAQAQMAQAAEHTFAGVKCGIMDQFASLFGRQGHVVQLDCRDLSYTYLPMELEGYQFLLLDTQVKHSLASSEYNTRRKECQAGVARLQRHYPEVKSLRDVTLQMLQAQRQDFAPLIYKRCRYVLEENQRVMATATALAAGDLARVGQLLYESHEGLQYDYEVSCKELDFLVEKAKSTTGILGARMMGGGFGGCTINLVEVSAVEAISQQMRKEFFAAFDREPGIYPVNLAQGAGPLERV